MNILFISNGIYEYDGRTRELIKVTEMLGEAVVVIRASDNVSNIREYKCFCNLREKSYPQFIIFCIKVALSCPQVDILFIDNRKAIIPGIIINLLKHPKYIIQDMRELYVFNEIKSISGKVGCLLERFMLPRVNQVIVANEFRAKYIQKKYNLKTKPLVYENIRKLSYDKEVDFEQLEHKFEKKFNRKTIKIISTSGYLIDRTNDVLVSAMKKLGNSYELFLVGDGPERDRIKILDIIKRERLKNVHLLGKLKENDLKYVIGKCDIGVVNYHMRDTNNRYCASGKIYEYLFEGLPVVTTENPPLTEFCLKYSVGIADNTYSKGILEISKNIEKYGHNVSTFIKTFDSNENNVNLMRNLRKGMQ